MGAGIQVEGVGQTVGGDFREGGGEVGDLVQLVVELVEAREHVSQHVHIRRRGDLGGVEVADLLADRKAQGLLAGQGLRRGRGATQGAGGDHGQRRQAERGGGAEPQVCRTTLPVLLPPPTIASAAGASSSGSRFDMYGLISPAAYRVKRLCMAAAISSGVRFA